MSATAGVVCLAKPGDAVVAGEPVLELHVDDPARVDDALRALDGAITVADSPPAPAPLIVERVG